MINEDVESKVMVDSKAMAGARALCAWVRRCRVAAGEVHGGVICEAVGSNGGVSVVVRSRGREMLYADGGSRAGAVKSSQNFPGGRAAAPKSGPPV